MNKIIEYYSKSNEEERLSSNNARKIEFITTTNKLEKLIDKNQKILDVGAGTGIYSIYFAEKGHEVVATDFVPKHVDIIREKVLERNIHNIETAVVDARDLSQFQDSTFDVVLCLGPIYHLLSEEDRIKCISECLRVLKSDGVLAIAYINKHFIVPYLATVDKKYIKSSLISKVINDGMIRERDEDCFWTDAYFTTPEEIENLVSRYSIKKLSHIATDGLSPMLRDSIDKLNEEEFNVWIEYHLNACEEESILGVSNHGLFIGQKVNPLRIKDK